MADKLTFGRQQFFEDTPKIIKRVRDSLNFFCAGVVVFLPWIAEKLHTTTDDLTTWIGLFMLGFNTLAKGFGVQPNGNGNGAGLDPTSIPTNDRQQSIKP